MRPRVLAGSTATLLLALLLGCGGYRAASSSARAKGRATIRVKWPTGAARLIPASAQSLVVTVAKGGTTVGTVRIVRPDASGTLTGLPYGSLDVTVRAYASTDGTGVAQAVGTGTMTVTEETPGTVAVAPGSTVAALSLPPSFAIMRGGGATVAVSAQDASGAIVPLVTSAGAETLTWTVTPSSVASVAGTGPTVILTGLAAGDATLAATLKVRDDGTTVASPALALHVTEPLAAVGLASPGWPVAGGDYGASGQGHGPAAGGSVGTALTVGDGTFSYEEGIATSAVTGPDDTLYAASDLKLVAQSSSGTTLWSVVTGLPVTGLTLTASGTLLVTGRKGIEARRADTGALLWSNALNDASDGPTTPAAVGRDGRVFVGRYAKLFALDGATGTILWTNGNALPRGRLAVGADGTLFAHYEATVTAYDPATGAVRWSKTAYRSDNLASDPCVVNGTVYLVTGKSSTTAGRALGHLDEAASIMTGEADSRAATPLDENGLPLIAGGRGVTGNTTSTTSTTGTTVTVGSTSGGGSSSTYYTYWSVVALNASDGSLKWAYDLPSFSYYGVGAPARIRSAPAVGGGRVVAQVFGCVVGLDAATGAKLWMDGTPSAGSQYISPIGISLASDGTAYVTRCDATVTDGSALQAIDPATGAVRWNASLGGIAYGYPAVAGDGTVYVSTRGKVVPIR